MRTANDTLDPQDCPDCIVDGKPCRYHAGYADGWDDASFVVGQFVELAGANRREPS